MFWKGIQSDLKVHIREKVIFVIVVPDFSQSKVSGNG